MTPRKTATWIFAVLLAVTWVACDTWLAVDSAEAQVVPGRPRPGVRRANARDPNAAADEDEEGGLEDVFMPPDRTLQKRLEFAREKLEEGEYGDAVGYLGSLLEGSEDFFFRPDPKKPQVYRSLKAEAGRLIGEMPPKGLEWYELNFGARARRMLNDAVTAGDVAGLSEVTRRFFYTKAGHEASVLLGRYHLDQGRPLAAALCLQRVRDTAGAAQRFEPMLSLCLATSWLRSGLPDKAQQALTQLKQNYSQATVRIADHPVELFKNDAQALAWLTEHIGVAPASHQVDSQQWALFRGDAGRNGAAQGGRPLLNPRWRVRCADDPGIAKVIEPLRLAFRDQDIAALPSLHPLAVGNVVLMRTSSKLQAVDFDSGKLIWDKSPLEGLSDRAPVARMPGPGGPANIAPGLERRMWDDVTYGTLSSDGQYVFSVEDLPLLPSSTNMRVVVNVNGQRRLQTAGAQKNVNRLTALELRTEGKLKWEVGGDEGLDEPKLAGAFFLGPPLPLQGRLYALAEMKGQEIRLVVLSAKTGALEWSQQVAQVEQNVLQDANRRLAGATPSFADGVLVCPTSAGAVVAVDLATRSLLWGYKYPRPQTHDRGLRMASAVYAGGDQRPGDRWVDGSATVVAGRVLLTPVETDQLYCISLVDGRLQWKHERGDKLYIACVHDGRAIAIGHKTIAAWQLADGKEVWKQSLPSGAVPSGRGFYSGDSYFLPLSTAEVVKVSLADGAIEARARSRSGAVPGNLICFKGEIISQGVDYVDAFYQVESLLAKAEQTLKDHPNDPRALARLGELKLDQKDLPGAIGLFRRSYGLEHDEDTRALLVDSILEGLRSDFAGTRTQAEEIEQLISERGKRNSYLRLVASGLQKSGDTLGALVRYIELIDDEAAPNDLEEVNETLSVRRERWLQARFVELRANAKPEEILKIDAVVADRLKTSLEMAEAAKSPKALRRFLKVFGVHPLADEAREKLAAIQFKEHRMEAEMLLRRLEKSPDPGRGARAVAQLALLNENAGRDEFAARYYQILRDRYADVNCRDGKTGKELAAAYAADSRIGILLAGGKTFPRGRVDAEIDKSGVQKLSQQRQQRLFDLDIVGDRGPYFSEMTVAIDPQQQQAIFGEDGLGNQRFRVSLVEPTQRRAANVHGYPSPMVNYAGVNGSLLALSMSYQLIAIDTLTPDSAGGDRVLWTQDLTEQAPGFSMSPGIHPQALSVPWGPARFVAFDAYGRPIGRMGPVNFDGVCFQRFRDLVCVHPLTGEVQWTRKNVPIGCDIMGDEEVLIVAPREGGDATVVSALDGEWIGKRRIEPLEQRMTTLGRNVLSWAPSAGKNLVSLRDPLRDEVIWKQEFAAGSKATIVPGEALGVMEPSGQFYLLNLADGELITREQLQKEPALMSIFLLRSREQYVLVTNAPQGMDANVHVQSAPGGPNNPTINGHVYAFQRGSGKKLWADAVEVKQQGLLLTQPSETPIVAFMSQRHRSQPGRAPSSKLAITCIDRRTGRVVYDNTQLDLQSINNFEMLANPEQGTVLLMLPNKTISLQFTDKSWSDPQQAAEKKGAAKAGAVLRILGGAAQRLNGADAEESP